MHSGEFLGDSGGEAMNTFGTRVRVPWMEAGGLVDRELFEVVFVDVGGGGVRPDM